MAVESVRTHWDEHGFAVLPGLLSSEELSPGLSELGVLFPTPEEFHSDVDPTRNATISVTNTEG